MLTFETFHPLVTPFATVLLFVTPIGLIIWSHVQTPSWHAAAFTTAVGGALGATLAYPTGLALQKYAVNPELVESYMGLHRGLATFTLVMSWLVVALIIRAYFVARYVPELPSHERVPYWTRFTVIALAFICGSAAAYTAHIGVTMVWGNV